MDGSRFDRLARIAGEAHSRRDALRLALAGAIGGGALVALDADAKKHRCKAKKGKKRCNGVCISIIDDPNNCGDCGFACDDGQTCVGGACFGGGGGLPIETPCDPATDVCEAGLACDSPTTRHTCSSTVEGIDNWCCLPPGAACDTECDCCGNNFCDGGRCKCNPEDGNCSGGTCNSSDDCSGNTPDCCDGTCVDTLSDPNNCGGCGAVCNGDCEAGTCVPPDRCSNVGVCNTPPPACGTTAPGDLDCSCEVAVENNRVCINFIESCDGLQACTSTDGDEATSCKSLVGNHFFCQKAKTDAQGRPCGCGQVCVPECDNPFPTAAAAKRHRGQGRGRRGQLTANASSHR
jgi:hypothetical protein